MAVCRRKREEDVGPQRETKVTGIVCIQFITLGRRGWATSTGLSILYRNHRQRLIGLCHTSRIPLQLGE